ncbi:glycosyltransferase [Heliorestis convoluta]|uniref:Glycosyltransferase n=1 Tax=Heliorestis convoluta TaxID=356322 RepID=A0A5Q2N4L5_9FIRM|nr:glycosyltransferase [Heliorestis convoluta]QGG47200.1 glycosyltransferase [Heliorestis convoluta]
MINSNKFTIFVPTLIGGGAERMMVNIARGIVEKGYDVDLVLVKAVGPYLSEVPKKVKVIDLNAFSTYASLPKLINYLRIEQPKSILSTLRNANITAILARKISKVKTRVIIREANITPLSLQASKGTNIKSNITSNCYLIKKIYPWADTIIAVSQGVAHHLTNTYGVASKKIRTIYNPVVTPELIYKSKEPVSHPWFGVNEPPVILAAGRLTKQKDFPTLIKAFSIVRERKNTRLIILGEGEERIGLENLIKKMGLESEISLPGFTQNPFAYMSKAKLFVLSSLWEGLPGVLIQAMACGTPVVSTECPSGPAEILENGRYGILVPVGDEFNLANAIEKALNESPDSSTLIKRANFFSLSEKTDEYLKELQ